MVNLIPPLLLLNQQRPKPSPFQQAALTVPTFPPDPTDEPDEEDGDRVADDAELFCARRREVRHG
jgi:hypothetical protein